MTLLFCSVLLRFVRFYSFFVVFVCLRSGAQSCWFFFSWSIDVQFSSSSGGRTSAFSFEQNTSVSLFCGGGGGSSGGGAQRKH